MVNDKVLPDPRQRIRGAVCRWIPSGYVAWRVLSPALSHRSASPHANHGYVRCVLVISVPGPSLPRQELAINIPTDTTSLIRVSFKIHATRTKAPPARVCNKQGVLKGPKNRAKRTTTPTDSGRLAGPSFMDTYKRKRINQKTTSQPASPSIIKFSGHLYPNDLTHTP